MAEPSLRLLATANYGDAEQAYASEDTMLESMKLIWTPICDVDENLGGRTVFFRGRIDSKKVLRRVCFLYIRDRFFKLQCIVEDSEMRVYCKSIPVESVVEVEGFVSVVDKAIMNATQKMVEIRVHKLFCISRPTINLPIMVEDCARSEAEICQVTKKPRVRVNQEARLTYRAIDLRTSANQGIFEIESAVCQYFGDFLRSNGFTNIHVPKLIAGKSEGGAKVFGLDYYNKQACLAQSQQLHKQIAINGDLKKVYAIGPVFRADESHTNRHLSEFIALDVEQEIHHYFEVIDLVDQLFVSLFDSLNSNCTAQLDNIRRQYPFQDLKYLKKTLCVRFEEGVEMLREAGVEINPLSDLTREAEKALGNLILKKHGTDFFILYHFPLDARPFFTMPDNGNPGYSFSFDAFMRGEEIISGGQRIHIPEVLEKRIQEKNIYKDSMLSQFIDSFRYGAAPRGGFGAGLERIVKLFCGLDNVRMSSLFPRFGSRLAP